MITFRAAKSNFFDRAKVVRAVNRARRKALSRVGAFVRTRARRSIRKPRQMTLAEMSPEQREQHEQRVRRARRRGRPRPKRPRAASKPGEPPRSPTGTLKKFLFFAFDQRTESVVVGPVALNGREGRDVPRTLEAGGTATLPDGRRITIEPRPYMGPALQGEVEAGTIPKQFRNSIRRSE